VIFHAAFRASEFHLVTNFQRLEVLSGENAIWVALA
jgi:hypothetical protein